MLSFTVSPIWYSLNRYSTISADSTWRQNTKDKHPTKKQKYWKQPKSKNKDNSKRTESEYTKSEWTKSEWTKSEPKKKWANKKWLYHDSVRIRIKKKWNHDDSGRFTQRWKLISKSSLEKGSCHVSYLLQFCKMESYLKLRSFFFGANTDIHTLWHLNESTPKNQNSSLQTQMCYL